MHNSSDNFKIHESYKMKIPFKRPLSIACGNGHEEKWLINREWLNLDAKYVILYKKVCAVNIFFTFYLINRQFLFVYIFVLGSLQYLLLRIPLNFKIYLFFFAVNGIISFPTSFKELLSENLGNSETSLCFSSFYVTASLNKVMNSN